MKRVKSIWALVVIAFAMTLASCERTEPFEPLKERKVFILYSCGYNNLSGNLSDDISLLCKDAPSSSLSNRNKLLIFSHKTASFGNYTTPTHPVLIDVYKDRSGNVVMDTVKVYPESVIGASARAVNLVLSDIKDTYPAKEYGMVMTSHATGWLPQDYYVNGGDSWGASFSAERAMQYTAMMYCVPLVKSMCAHYDSSHGQVKSAYEMEIDDFAEAVPIHLKYLVLDMCLMGCVECAYEFRNIVDYLAVSPTEILSDGMEYGNMLNRLLYSAEADVRGVCDDYYHYYADKDSYATISLIDCRKMEYLASVCADLFEEYADAIDGVNPDGIQRYWRDGKHWFYDLRDILVKSGISADDLSALDDALASCVLYNAATDYFLTIPIRNHCGLSMYLPKMDRDRGLRSFYSTLAWNKATSLVR